MTTNKKPSILCERVMSHSPGKSGRPGILPGTCCENVALHERRSHNLEWEGMTQGLLVAYLLSTQAKGALYGNLPDSLTGRLDPALHVPVPLPDEVVASAEPVPGRGTGTRGHRHAGSGSLHPRRVRVASRTGSP